MECGLRANELWDAVDPGGDAYKKEGAECRGNDSDSKRGGRITEHDLSRCIWVTRWF